MSVQAIGSQRTTASASSSGNDYTVQRGDTLSGIAARHGVSLSALEAANPQIHNPNVIYPGQTVHIPGGGPATGGASAPDAPAGSTPSTLQGREDQAMGYFMSQGWTRAQAAGIVANLEVESAHTLDPHIQQYGGGPGYGIAQWEGPRQAQFAQVFGHDIHSATYQEELQFVQWELKHTESHAGTMLGQASNAYDAGMTVLNYYERPANRNQPARGQLAQQIDQRSNPGNAPSEPPPPSPSKPKPAPHPSTGDYTVRRGDTLSGIASRHGVSLSALEHANPQIGNPNRIYPGQTIHIPGGGASPKPASHDYTVRSGDTLSGIASRHGVSLSALEHANPQIGNPNRIYPGQTIHIPGGSASPKPASHDYTVRSGDTLSGIASRHGVSLSALEHANPQISNPSRIYPGQTVHIPGRAGGGSPVQGGGSVHGTGAARIAEQYLGQNISSLKRSGALPMNPNVPSDVCCANFVSAVLQKAGAINFHTDSVSAGPSSIHLGNMLEARGWHRVPASQAKPGDVCILNYGDHVELVDSNRNGDITLIGSNNVNADGTQRVSHGHPYGNAYYLAPPS